MFGKQQNPKEFNKILSVTVDKQGLLFGDYEETNNVQLEVEIYE